MDAYAISSSDSSSYCTDPAERSHLTSGAGEGEGGASHLPSSQRQEKSTGASGTAHAAAASSSHRTPRQETASTTIRKVNTDYSKSMEQQNARAAALQRYKMLVRSSRLVPGEPGETVPAAATAEEAEAGGSSRRQDSKRKSHGRRSSGAAAAAAYNIDNNEAAVSDNTDSDNEDVAVSAVSNHRVDTAPSPPNPTSASAGKKQADQPPAASKVPASTPVLQEAGGHEKSRTKQPPPVVAHEATPNSSSVRKSASKSKSRRGSTVAAAGHKEDDETDPLPEKCPYPVSYENEAPPEYQPPEQTEPIVKPSNPSRDSIRPNYEPVSESELSAPATKTSNSRKSRVVAAAANPNEEEAAPEPAAENDDEDEEVVVEKMTAADAEAPAPSNAKSDKDSSKVSHRRRSGGGDEEGEHLPVAGASKTAFWVRPNSALYEMTASVAAKRKDHPPSKYEEEMGYARIDSSRGSSTFHSSSSGSHGGQEKPRSSRRMSTRPNFETRLSGRRGSVGEAAAAEAVATAPRSPVLAARGGGGALRGTDPNHQSSRGSSVDSNHRSSQPTQAINSPRGGGSSAVKRSSAGARPQPSAPKESTSRSSSALDAEGQAAPDSRVADRQTQYYEKHCARMVSGRQPAADPPQKPATTGSARLNSSRASSSTFSAASKSSAPKSSGVIRRGSNDECVKATKQTKQSATAMTATTRSAGEPVAAVSTVPVLGSPTEARRTSTQMAKESPHVSKMLQYDLDTQQQQQQQQQQADSTGAAEDASTAKKTNEEEEMVSPMRTVPQATPLAGSPKSGARAAQARGTPANAKSAEKSTRKGAPQAPLRRHVDAAGTPAPAESSLLIGTPVHLRPGNEAAPAPRSHNKKAQDGTPSKARRTELNRVASESPARDESPTNEAAVAAAANKSGDTPTAAHSTRQRAAMAQGSRERSGSLPTAAQSRTRMATNEVVASMLQGIVHQSRRVLPCYLCAEMQNVGTYSLHLDICAAKTQMLMQDRGGLSEETEKLVEAMVRRELPTMSTTDEEREAFSHDCYVCAKALLVPCSKCGSRIRVHDAKEHELLCGRSYYENGKTGLRHREAVGRIEQGAASAEGSP